MPGKKSPQDQLVAAARQFSAGAAHHREQYTDSMPGMRHRDPEISVERPASDWTVIPRDGYALCVFVEWDTEPLSERSLRCSINVQTSEGPLDQYFDFYAYVFTNGLMFYRTETWGTLLPEFAEFVSQLGIEPNTADKSRLHGPTSYSIDAVLSGSVVPATQRVLSPEQALKLAEYLLEPKHS